MVNGRQTRAGALRQRGRQQLARQQLQPQRLSPEQIKELREQRRQELIEEQRKKLEEQRKEKFEKRLSALQEKLEKIKSRPASPGRVSNEIKIQTQIRKLKTLQKQGVPLGQATDIARRTGKITGLQSAFARGTRERQQRLQQAGVDLEALQKGELDVQELQPQQIQALQREGLVETREPQSPELQRIREQGLEPLIVKGELRGTRNPETNTIDFLPESERIDLRNQIGDVSTRIFTGDFEGGQTAVSVTAPTSISTQELEKQVIQTLPPRGEVQPAPNFLERLGQSVKRNIPELKFIEDKQIRQGLQEALLPAARIGGAIDFSESELQRFLGQLKDDSGRFVFTPTQANRIGKLTAEIGTGFSLGLGSGKALTLARGGVLSALPKGLKQGNKFKKVVNALDVAILGTLTAAEAKRINKVFKEQGEEAALIELIGDVSFVSGFTRTGLKTDIQAEKEFRDLANKFEKTLPKGKRGQVGLLRRRKRKKGELSAEDIRELDVDEDLIKQRRDIEADIEKKLANAKTPEEQFKIIANLRRKITNANAKKNFDKFLLDLFNKGIIKGQKIEVGPGITARTIRPITTTKPQIQKTIPTSKLRQDQRTKRNQQKNRQRVQQAQKPLGQRFKEAQLGLTSQRTRQRQQQRTSQIQKLRQNQLERQAQKQQQRLQQRQIQRQKLRQRLRNSLRIGQKAPEKLRIRTRLKPRPKKPKFPRLDIIDIDFPSKKKRKKITSPLFAKSKVQPFVKTKPAKENKFRRIGRPTTQRQALRKLTNEVEGTLRASGFILDSQGRRVRPKQLPRGFRFSRNKKTPNLIVERKSRRLDTKSETSAIQKARKSNLKSSKLIKTKNGKKK